MLGYYCKLVCRNFFQNRSLSTLKVLSLTVGIASFIFIFQHVMYEKSYDAFHGDVKSIYRVERCLHHLDGNYDDAGITSSQMIGMVLKEEYPEVAEALRLHPVYGDATVQVQEQGFLETKLFFSDENFFRFFDFQLLKGDKESLLRDPGSVVLSESLAKKYFGQANPVGQTIKLYCRYVTSEYTVKGVFKDFPANTHLSMDALFSNHQLLQHRIYHDENPWKWGNFHTYIKLADPGMGHALPSYTREVKRKYKIAANIGAHDIAYRMKPLGKIHLDGERSYAGDNKSSFSLVVFLFIGILVLGVSCINFMNLSVSGYLGNHKLFRVNTFLGASRSQTRWLFTMDSFYSCFLALGLSMGLVYALKPLFVRFTGLCYEFSLVQLLLLWASSFAGFAIFFMLVAQYSFFANQRTKQGTISRAGNQQSFWLSMQFLASIILLSVSFFAMKQTRFLQNKDIGIELDKVMAVRTPRVFENGQDHWGSHEVFREEVKKIPGVEAVANSVYIPGMFIATIQATGLADDPANKFATRINFTGKEYGEAYQNKLLAGRFFSSADKGFHQVVINQTAMKKYGFRTPAEALGQTVHWFAHGRKSKIIGVVEDFNHESPRHALYPLAMYKIENVTGYYSIRLSNTKLATVQQVEEAFQRVFPGNPFEMHFQDAYYDAQYHHFYQQVKIFWLFAFIAIIVSIFGLMGLVKYTVEKKKKEIGIRRVNGAKISEIHALIQSVYMKSLLVAYVPGMLMAYVFIIQWIENFATKTKVSWWIFALSGATALGIAIVTVAWQSWQAARRNPVESLRYE